MKPARLAFAAVLLATTAMAGCTLPAVLPGSPVPAASPAAIVLVPAGDPAFPYSITGLGAAASFASDTGEFISAYYGRPVIDRVTITVWIGPLRYGQIPLSPTTFGGRQAMIGHDIYSDADLIWQRQPDKWLELDGQGRYGTEQAVLALADRLTATPQSMRYPWVIGRVPRGWTLDQNAFGPFTYAYTDTRNPSGAALSIASSDGIAPDLSKYAAGWKRTVTVPLNGRNAPIAETATCWLMQGQLPNGKIFDLKAPLSFSPATVAAIVASVTAG